MFQVTSDPVLDVMIQTRLVDVHNERVGVEWVVKIVHLREYSTFNYDVAATVILGIKPSKKVQCFSFGLNAK